MSFELFLYNYPLRAILAYISISWNDRYDIAYAKILFIQASFNTYIYIVDTNINQLLFDDINLHDSLAKTVSQQLIFAILIIAEYML